MKIYFYYNYYFFEIIHFFIVKFVFIEFNSILTNFKFFKLLFLKNIGF